MDEDSEPEIDPFGTFRIDVIPNEAELFIEGDIGQKLVRFRAGWDFQEIYSPWTPWYGLEDTPITLCWQNMWPGGDPIRN